jgi:hypothetical protein
MPSPPGTEGSNPVPSSGESRANLNFLEAEPGLHRPGLPLLREAFVTPGWVSDDAFLAGYGAAQAVPGPLFTFAAYLGAVVRPSPHGLPGAALGLIGLFLPGVLILNPVSNSGDTIGPGTVGR